MKDHIISFAQTFASSFITSVITLISVIPADTLFTPTTWTSSFVAGIVLAAARTAVKVAWPKIGLPTA